MRRSTNILIGALLLGSSVGVIMWLLQTSKQRQLATITKTQAPVKRDIIDKRVISGELVPCQEVALNTDLSGILDTLYVSVGDKVTKGMAIARVKVIPKSSDVESAKKLLHIARITLEEAEERYQRSKQLFEKAMLSPEQYAKDVKAWKIAKEEATYAQKKLNFVLRGHIAGAQGASNIIRSTIEGVVSELPCKKGSTVMEYSSFKEGSTIATISDMRVMLFQGKVGEMDVVYLRPGMQFDVSLIAIPGKKFPTTLTKVAPKVLKSKEDKSIKFAIEGIVQLDAKNQASIRAGYTALADIVLDKAVDVLAIEEKWVHTEDTEIQVSTTPAEDQDASTPFVWVHEGDKKLKKYVELGVSDGIYVEVKKGLAADDQIIISDDSY